MLLLSWLLEWFKSSVLLTGTMASCLGTGSRIIVEEIWVIMATEVWCTGDMGGDWGPSLPPREVVMMAGEECWVSIW